MVDQKDSGGLDDPNSPFASIRLKVNFKNITSQSAPKDNASISLIEFGDHTLVFELPKASCNLGHQIFFEIYKDTPIPELVLHGTGKVVQVDKNEDETLVTLIQLSQYEEKDWDKLTHLYATRQEEISKFLELVKG